MEPVTADRVFFDATLPVPLLVEFARGRAAVFSQRCPQKDTPNEDAVALLPAGESSGAIVLADGCGGMARGELAARTAIEAIQEEMSTSKAEGPTLRPAILDGMEAANRRVCHLAGGAATTLAIVEIDGTMIRPYHVGDSAIMVVGNRGRIKLQTISHSPVGYAVEAGVLDEREAIHHADRHLVSNVLGFPEAHIEIGSRRKLSLRDTVVVGSDGLFDNLHVEEIVEIVRKGPLAGCAEKLAALATQRMEEMGSDLPSKPDDLTFVLFRPN